MSPFEIVELFRDTATEVGWAAFEHYDLTPAAFGDKQGFRFGFSFKSKSGLAFKGFARAMVDDNRLFFLSYWGTELHYFPKHEKDAEQLFDSLELT